MTEQKIGIHNWPGDFPEKIWLGKKANEWPIIAFGSEDHAAMWAADKPSDERRYVIGPVVVPYDLPLLLGERIPERHVLVAKAEA